MENQVMVLVPSKGKRILLTLNEESQEFRKPIEIVRGLQLGRGEQDEVQNWLETLKEKERKATEKRLQFFQNLPREIVLLGIMGGPGQAIFNRASQMGIQVQRIPWYRLEELTSLPAKASAQERVLVIRQAWERQPEAFYALGTLDPIIVLIRELTRVRLGIQEIFRKPANLQYQAAWRELEVLLPEGEGLISLRTFFSNQRFIEGAKKDEEELEDRISELLKDIPIWKWLSPKDSALPLIKGLGPSLGGSIISEIGDIRRFPTREALRAYARFHVVKGRFPRRERGEISPWNRYLNRAVWVWSTDQMPRYDHSWRLLYDWKKAKELQAHPETVAREMTDKRGRKRTVWDFTLKHLDIRAKRWVGSQFLNYLWDLWQVVEQNGNPELWYSGSSWPAYFARIEQELQEGLRDFLIAEIPKRRRREPREELEEEEV